MISAVVAKHSRIPPAHRPQPTVICFGEALWDVLPTGIFLGGAPLNVAYHLARHGLRAVPVSAVGNDFLGDEVLRRVGSWGATTTGITRSATRRTGVVHARLNASGAATYEIATNVAWDRITVQPAALRSSTPAAIVYGTLALRDPHNRSPLQALFGRWPTALRVLDLNLRPPFCEPAALAFALRHAEFVKLNDEELARTTGAATATTGQIENAAKTFASNHRVRRVCVTAGARGAGLLWDGRWHWRRGRKVRVCDTIGAGDAFLAALLAALLLNALPPQKALAKAGELGEFIAARRGATPPYSLDERGRPRDEAETAPPQAK